MMTRQKAFDDCREWEVVGHDLRIRYRPRCPPVGETLEVTLPVALKAVEGKLTHALGDGYASCAALVGLRLGPGPSIGQLDLMLLARSGAIALGECKLSVATSYGPSIHCASRQIARYERAIRGSGPTWLRERIVDSYDKFGFPDCRQFLAELGAKSDEDQRDWWAAISDTIRRGAFDMFIAIRTREESSIDIWRRSRLLTVDHTSTRQDIRHNNALHRSGARVARSGR